MNLFRSLSVFTIPFPAAVKKMQDMIKEHKIRVMATNATYMSSYATIPKPFWWDVSQCGGPIVEQGTHLCKHRTTWMQIT